MKSNYFSNLLCLSLLFSLFFCLGCKSDKSGSFTVLREKLVLLPDSGQTICYDTNGNTIACPTSGSSLAQDGSYTINAPSYTDNGNGTITDNNTQRIWQKEDNNTQSTWAAANTYCADSTLANYDDWRLPNIFELFSVVDESKSNPAINETYFPNTDSAYFWTSTVRADVSTDMWLVGFNEGDTATTLNTNSYYNRCVRGGSGSDIWTPDFSDLGGGITLHTSTGLMWQQNGDTTGDWASALSTCESLTLDAYENWRLPNIKELQTIADYTATSSPRINTIFFTGGASSAYFWSSTTYVGQTTRAWRAWNFNGNSYYETKTIDTYNIRCVRNK